jgi:hypothetical protein
MSHTCRHNPESVQPRRRGRRESGVAAARRRRKLGASWSARPRDYVPPGHSFVALTSGRDMSRARA